MRNTAVAALLTLALATTAAAEETHRYLVATKKPFRAGALAAVLRDARQDVSPREVEGFHSFDGFAADLTASEVAELRRNPNVRWVEDVVERHAFARPMRNLNAQTVPYGIDLIHAREAWLARNRTPINVVVIDTGVDYHHAELKSIWAGGHDFANGDDDPMDDGDHGTHVAGTIAAANDQSGVVGVAPDVRLWGLKVLNASGTGSSELIMHAIDWIIQKKNALGGNWVANLSLGAGRGSAAEREAFKRGKAAGILFVAASGNDSTATVPAPVSYPAAYDEVVAVGAVDDAMAIAEFSNQGAQLDVVAPGVDVLSTLPVGKGSVAWVGAQGNTLMGGSITGSPRGRVTGDYVFCGLGNPAEIPASVAGKIALIKRGTIKFAEKARNAKQAGAIGVAIFNHDTSAMNWTLVLEDEPWTQTFEFPVTVALTNADGEKLAAQNSGAITLVSEADDYGYASGTSMATPHVAAAAAMVWSAAPTASADAVAGALTATARDLGTSGQDNVFGAGLINVYEAIKRLAPGSFAPPPNNGPTTGRTPGRRG